MQGTPHLPISRESARTRPRTARGLLRAAASAAVALLLGACASVGPHPWERDLMARPEMALDGGAIDGSIDDHVYFSKEGATGGRGFAGGGCGCN